LIIFMETPIKNSEYTFEFDTYKEGQWDDLLSLFNGATLYQSWPYVSSRIHSGCVSSLVMKMYGNVMAAALVRIEKAPLLGIGMAYVSFGPLWRLRGEGHDFNKLLIFLRALRHEYCRKRCLYLRVKPNVFDNVEWCSEYKKKYIEAGYRCIVSEDRTLILDLSPPIEDIRNGLHPKWRNLLNSAEKGGLSIRTGTAKDLFEVFKRLYYEMLNRKSYDTDVNINAYGEAIAGLPPNLQPKVVIAEAAGAPTAGAVISINGDTGIYCLGATSAAGMKNKSSYFVQWHVINYLKSIDARYYDLGGCSPKKVPSTYHFKAGICGKAPIIRRRVGIMNACDNPINLAAVAMADVGFSKLRFLKKVTKYFKKGPT
jgi:lipid II:glycine glycyltransferase (peptidoglycan interpeptide bridge formation enzyme)